MTQPASVSADNADQIEYWNSGPGAKWVANQDALDATFADVKNRLLERSAVRAGERVLDIGCGAGATTLDLARRVGPSGSILAVDVAAPLLARARARAAEAGLNNVDFVLGDAQVHAFAPEAFDLMASRFGVMFFSDSVGAFANIAAALNPGGRVAFVSWSDAERNPWFAIPARVAAARLGAPAPVPPNSPGPMAFSDTAYTRGILTKAGLKDIEAHTEEIQLTVPGALGDVVKLATSLGPVSRIMKEREGTPEDLAAIARDLEGELAGFMTDTGFRIPATLIFYRAAKS